MLRYLTLSYTFLSFLYRGEINTPLSLGYNLERGEKDEDEAGACTSSATLDLFIFPVYTFYDWLALFLFDLFLAFYRKDSS